MASGMDSLGEALLNWGFLRTGVRRARTEELSDHLRRDLGLLPRSRAAVRPARSALVGHEAEGLVRGRRAMT